MPKQPLDEATIIANMKEVADTYGLWWEVKGSYDSYRKEGNSPEEAASWALFDWNI
jgi:hypothetical protein